MLQKDEAKRENLNNLIAKNPIRKEGGLKLENVEKKKLGKNQRRDGSPIQPGLK